MEVDPALDVPMAVVDKENGPSQIPHTHLEGYKAPWVEAYRPRTLDDVLGNEETILRLRAIAKDGNMPNLILCGPPGTGALRVALRCVGCSCMGKQPQRGVAACGNQAIPWCCVVSLMACLFVCGPLFLSWSHARTRAGKTTSVHALARELLGSAYKDAVLELNASDARGIDVRTVLRLTQGI